LATDTLIEIFAVPEAMEIIRIIGAIGPVTSDTIAAAECFADKNTSLFAEGLLWFLAKEGYVKRCLLGAGARDVYEIDLAPRGREMFDRLIDEWVETGRN
jgi:hypothetical protein